MAYQNVFKRYEIKYLITKSQQDIILEAMKPYMSIDKYGKTTIRNIYFDTDNYLLIRRSIEKPIYKEKIRIRSYKNTKDDNLIFVEMKRKYKGEVYKRRISLKEDIAYNWVTGKIPNPNTDQISNEIDYFIKYYDKLKPAIFLSYDRVAYYDNEDINFRVTFDENILCRDYDYSFEIEPSGNNILPDGYILMEIKSGGSIPLWFVSILSKLKVYKTSFSKYGNAYQKILFNKNKVEE